MTPDKNNDGPSLETYVETRFNLLVEFINEKFSAQDVGMRAHIDAVKVMQAASDLRYQQRFEAQSDALTAALQAAKEAVQAAQAAADRAVAKAEAAADKRFEALNELRQMLNDVVGTMLTRNESKQLMESVSKESGALSERIARLESILDKMAGSDTGERRSKTDMRAIIGLGITVLLAILALAGFIIARTGGQ